MTNHVVFVFATFIDLTIYSIVIYCMSFNDMTF